MLEIKKKILVVDDSALMRSVLCDIINGSDNFCVKDRAINGRDALDLILKNDYDAIVLDVNMPIMNGVELLKELHRRRFSANIMMASTDTMEGAKVTLDCLELGALDFIHKPDKAQDCRDGRFQEKFLRILTTVANAKKSRFVASPTLNEMKATKKIVELASKNVSTATKRNQIVALASSTGGPKALHQVIPLLPGNLSCPIVIVQHMPAGFTKTLADRLNTMCELNVKEAEEGETIETGNIYISKGGAHMNIVRKGSTNVIHYTDEPQREGVKPCANYMYESLRNTSYENILCVVLTGMGQDGTEGIKNLKAVKKIHTIAQEESTCVVYGMPKAVVNNHLADQIVPLGQIAQEIIMNVGVK
ncbi:MAG: chemotaxis-specific protein-glutamate methyltransferase CheB [Lachnospiraceae bacterium]|nr:chemotaxis-specific protein-glutamate methyltransferase CheB [Candidatus Merdinaster equi]